jgi:hypothetical protein
METSEPAAGEEDGYDDPHETSTTPQISSRRHLLLLAVLVPAAVAITNQLLFSAIANRVWPQSLLYPWMAFSTAILSWCVGRYLDPPWLRWLVFGWCLALLDILTIAACLSGPIPRDFAYVLVAAQAGLLVVWSVSANLSWQIRLPMAMLAAAFLIAFAGIWRDDEWSVLVTVTVLIVCLVSGILRWKGYTLHRTQCGGGANSHQADFGTLQFGIRHMLIWAAAIAPLLIVARGVEFFMFAGLGGKGALPGLIISLCLAITALTAIWSVLGGSPWFVRIPVLVVMPCLLAYGLETYARHIRTPAWSRWSSGIILNLLWSMHGHWSTWIGVFTALLAALLLFLRANGYLLRRALAATAASK